jgi:hypothetical protein
MERIGYLYQRICNKALNIAHYKLLKIGKSMLYTDKSYLFYVSTNNQVSSSNLWMYKKFLQELKPGRNDLYKWRIDLKGIIKKILSI